MDRTEGESRLVSQVRVDVANGVGAWCCRYHCHCGDGARLSMEGSPPRLLNRRWQDMAKGQGQFLLRLLVPTSIQPRFGMCTARQPRHEDS